MERRRLACRFAGVPPARHGAQAARLPVAIRLTRSDSGYCAS
jgi:hypothetical protein